MWDIWKSYIVKLLFKQQRQTGVYCKHRCIVLPRSSWMWPRLLEESQTMQGLSSSSLLINSRSLLRSVALMSTDDVGQPISETHRPCTSARTWAFTMGAHGFELYALALAPLTQGKLNIHAGLTCLRGYQVTLMPCPVALVNGWHCKDWKEPWDRLPIFYRVFFTEKEIDVCLYFLLIPLFKGSVHLLKK